MCKEQVFTLVNIEKTCIKLVHSNEMKLETHGKNTENTEKTSKKFMLDSVSKKLFYNA